MIEQEIMELIGAAGIRLRFDRVVLRMVGDLKAALADLVPEGQALLFTCTAPIRQAGKTVKAMESLVRGGFSGNEVRDAIQGNQIRIRLLSAVPAGRPKVLGFVHNPDKDAGVILDLAESRLHAADKPSGNQELSLSSGRSSVRCR